MAEKQAAKSRKNVYGSCTPQEGEGARARPLPALPRGVPSARAGFFLYIYPSISTYLSLYIIYIDIHLSLSLFEQVKLLERAEAGARLRYEAAIRFLRLPKEYETNPRGCLRCSLLGAAP